MNDNIGPMAVMAVIVILIVGILAGMFSIPGIGLTTTAKPHVLPYTANINITESGLPSGTKWSGSVVVQGGSYIVFSTTSTYDNITIGSSSARINGSYNMNLLLIGANHYYKPIPQGGTFFLLEPYEPYLNVAISYVELTGYLANVTTYSLPFGANFTGYFYNNLYPANQTYYIQTTSNTISTILPNGTWFLHVNDSYFFNKNGYDTQHYQALVNNFSFVMDGANYTIVVQFIDVTPNQEFLIHFEEHGLASNTPWQFTINRTTYYTNTTGGIGVPVTLAPRFYNITASAIGYTYTGPARIYIGVDGMIVYLNFTNNSKVGTVNQIGGILAGAGVSLTGFYSSVTLLVALGATIGTYYKFEDLVVSAALFVVIPWIVYGLGVASGEYFIQLWVPLWMLLFAFAGLVFTAVIRGRLSGSAE